MLLRSEVDVMLRRGEHSVQSYRMYIDGAWCDASSGRTRDAINPATGEAFARFAEGGREDARRAIAAANAAQRSWARVSLFERADLCLKMSAILEENCESIADILCTETGKPRHVDAIIEAKQFVPVFYRQAAELARYQEGFTSLARDPQKRLTAFRRPRGTVAVITPWNFPAMIPSEYIPYALVMGNTVVWTPAPTATVCAVKLMELLETSGLPKGVLNLVTGPGHEVGDEFVCNPGTHAIAMTGSSQTGRKICDRAGIKPKLLELGGNGPTIVLADADPKKAAQSIASACFFGAGQVCSSAERIFVAQEIHDAFASAMVDCSRQYKTGDVWHSSTTMGPQNNLGVVEKMELHVEDAKSKGATVLTGGRRVKGPGYFFEPTVLTGFSRDSRVNLEETFGPIAPIRAFSSESEAWDLIDACDLGLVSSVFTDDLNQAWRWAEGLRTGIVSINENSNYWEPHIAFGGMSGTQSGIGRLGGRHVLEFMSEIQTIAFHVRDENA